MVEKALLNFKLQCRQQDSGWEDITGEEYEHCGDAVCRASELAENVFVGMVRVIDICHQRCVTTYAAGGGFA